MPILRRTVDAFNCLVTVLDAVQLFLPLQGAGLRPYWVM